MRLKKHIENHRNGQLRMRYDYYVNGDEGTNKITSHGIIYHGFYEWYNKNGVVQQKGHYQHNTRIKLWEFDMGYQKEFKYYL